ncbi:MAG: tRNA (cytidine32/uridine32-2'-O)-methyltransferase [Rhodothermales bacterium]|jgi:tRNA (cytidine32/uridine32-2'-O)-methyltransferase
MKNMGLHDLALVKPRYFPHEDASARASGAEDILQDARVVDSLAEAVSDCSFVAGASARSRAFRWTSMAPRECAERLWRESASGQAAAVFGPEHSGLSNEHLDFCHVLLTIPTVPGFSSLNLAMAVQVLTYELRVANMGEPSEEEASTDVLLATGEEMEGVYANLERVMIRSGFLNPEHPRLLMRRLRRLLGRAEPDKEEIKLLRAILASLDTE